MPPEVEVSAKRFLGLVKAGSRILDLGCGTGRDLTWFENHQALTIGADLSNGMLTEARRQVKGPLIQANMLRLGLSTGRLGGVWANACLLHLPKASMPEALQEISRVLQPGGIFYASLKEGTGEQFVPMNDDAFPLERFFAFYQLDELLDIYQQAGFIHIENGITKLPQSNWIWYIGKKRG